MKFNIIYTLLFALFLGFSQNVVAKVYLVSVGISDYPGIQNDLNLPVNDAKKITWLYTKNTDVEYRQLLDSNATVSNISSAIKNLFVNAKTSDIVVLFFSGHGYPGGFVAYDDLMSYAEVRRAMALSRCKNKMIFADACFSGKIRTPKRESSSSLSATKKANVLLFLSSRGKEVSIESRKMKNGFFTHCLQRGLRGGADVNRDRRISAKELFNYVCKGVKKLSNDEQHPVMWGNFSDNMPVMVW